MEDQPELAYLDLVSCGEVISNGRAVSNDALYDDELKQIFRRIENEVTDGDQMVSTIKSRLYQVRRRFALTIKGLLDDYFFSHHEAINQSVALKLDSTEDALKAAYDLRSRYVHTGVRFGTCVMPHRTMLSEIQLGEPVLDDTELKKALIKAPNLLGMERIMRYALLKVSMEAGAVLQDLFEEKQAEQGS